jgi:hypothetical protein
MIVRTFDDGLLLITQPDHAGLSGRIMAAWLADGLPELDVRDEILEAARVHDIGWIDPDAAPLVNPASGRPYDFIDAPVATKQAVWRRALERLRGSPYVAALVAQHALTIYERFRGDAGWSLFFEEITAARDDLVRRARTRSRGADSVTAGQFRAHYRFVRLGDIVSLVFCNGWTEPEKVAGYRVTLHGRDVSLSPDPFRGAAVAMSVRARFVPDRRYGSADELRLALESAKETTLDGWCRGS